MRNYGAMKFSDTFVTGEYLFISFLLFLFLSGALANVITNLIQGSSHSALLTLHRDTILISYVTLLKVRHIFHISMKNSVARILGKYLRINYCSLYREVTLFGELRKYFARRISYVRNTANTITISKS